MIAVDGSVLTHALTDGGPLGAAGRAELARDPHRAAPEHLLLEVFSAVRGLHRGGKISGDEAEEALDGLASATVQLVGIRPLLARMWDLRDSLTGYDEAYVAVAETLGCPLVTADARLVRSAGATCEVRLALPVG